MLFVKYSSPDFTAAFEKEGALEKEKPFPQDGNSAPPEELADDLEKMGPTFVKLGQLLSSRADLLPEPYLKALSRLQDKVKPFPFEDVETIVEMELGTKLNKAFSFFDRDISIH